MAHYLMLGKYTEKGMTTIDQSAERIKRFKELCQGEGGKVVSYYMLMGKFDVACVIEAPNADAMAKIALVVGRVGNVRTQTLCAFTEKEQIDMVSKLSK